MLFGWPYQFWISFNFKFQILYISTLGSRSGRGKLLLQNATHAPKKWKVHSHNLRPGKIMEQGTKKVDGSNLSAYRQLKVGSLFLVQLSPIRVVLCVSLHLCIHLSTYLPIYLPIFFSCVTRIFLSSLENPIFTTNSDGRGVL